MSDETPVEDVPTPEPAPVEVETCPFYANCGKVLADVVFCQRCGYEAPKR